MIRPRRPLTAPSVAPTRQVSNAAVPPGSTTAIAHLSVGRHGSVSREWKEPAVGARQDTVGLAGAGVSVLRGTFADRTRPSCTVCRGRMASVSQSATVRMRLLGNDSR
jgi:hypothetical protein